MRRIMICGLLGSPALLLSCSQYAQRGEEGLLGEVVWARVRVDEQACSVLSHRALSDCLEDQTRALRETLERLFDDRSPAANRALVQMLDLYLGEHYGEVVVAEVARRGQAVVPLLRQAQARGSSCSAALWPNLCLDEQTRRERLQDCLTRIGKAP